MKTKLIFISKLLLLIVIFVSWNYEVNAQHVKVKIYVGQYGNCPQFQVGAHVIARVGTTEYINGFTGAEGWVEGVVPNPCSLDIRAEYSTHYGEQCSISITGPITLTVCLNDASCARKDNCSKNKA